MIKPRIQKPQAVTKAIRMFLAHYLTSVQGIGGFQNDAITLLATWITKLIKKLASRAKAITNMQNRTESNVFHLMWCIEDEKLAPLSELITYMRSKKSQTSFNYAFFDKLKEEVFGDDTEKLNKLQVHETSKNITFLQRPYTIQVRNQALPFKYLIQQLYPFPPQYAYKSTKRLAESEQVHCEHLHNQAGRQTKKTIASLSRNGNPDNTQTQIVPQQIGIKKMKRVNLLSDI